MKKGFTLIELLVVVLIIGVLTAIALPGYRKAVERSKVTEVLNTMSAVANSEHNWYLIHNEYTDDFSDLDVELTDKDGNRADEDTFETTHYINRLSGQGIIALRTNGEYFIYKDFETGQILCSPSEHYVCNDLGNFTKVPCENGGLTWANTNGVCYISDQARCTDLYGSSMWKGSYCGYGNVSSMTLNEGMTCKDSRWQGDGCTGSIVNAGGTCLATYRAGCLYSTINAGGVCTETQTSNSYNCRYLTVNTGGTCIGEFESCTNSNYNGGTCFGNGMSACQGSTFTAGARCISKGGYSCRYTHIYSGSVCEANNNSACSNITVYDGGKCVLNGNTSSVGGGACRGTYYGTGCCEGKNCYTTTPKCACPIDASTGKHKTSC